jgi:predicted XRE-type DNA-binding protein
MKRKPPTDSKARLETESDFSANLIARSELMLTLVATIKEKGWTQEQAAEFLGVGQPRISDVVQGRLERFSVDMLMTWLQKLGKDVSVSVRNNIFSSNEMVVLVLYVCGVPDDRLLDNINKLFGGNEGKYTLRVVDVLQNPELASEEKISSTPSLIKEAPFPRVVLTGDMSTASVRWQLTVAERLAQDNQRAALELRQVSQDQREKALGEREEKLT